MGLLIGIDIDGVLYPWDECARDAVVTKFGLERPGPSTHWSYLKNVLPGGAWRWLWSAEGQRETFGRVERTYPGVVEAFGSILKSGHECHFVTHRDPRRTALPTADFLARHFGAHPWAGVHVIQASTPKHSLAEWDVFIDDKVDTVLDMLVLTRAQVFAPVRPWNGVLNDVVPRGDERRFTYYNDPREVADWVLSQ